MRSDAYSKLLHFDNVVEQIFKDADERRCSDTEAYKQEHVVLSVVLCWSSIRSIYQ